MNLVKPRIRMALCCGLLLSLAVTAASQSKGKHRPARSGARQVTVTLVRWPYT